MEDINEAKKLFLAGVNALVRAVGVEGLSGVVSDTLRALDGADLLYQPDAIFIKRLEEFRDWCVHKSGEDKGQLMEEIAFLSLRCLDGYESVASFQSYAAQVDLLMSGSTPMWMVLMNHLHLDTKYRSIAVEAKNLDEKVSDNQFSRFCYHMQNMFESTAQLGIFWLFGTSRGKRMFFSFVLPRQNAKQ